MVEYSTTAINVITAFLIIILGLVIGSIFDNIIRRFLRGLEINSVLEEHLKIKLQLEQNLSTFVKYMIYFVAIIIALDKLGVPTKILRIVFIVLFILVIIFVVLAFKDWVPNLLSGFYILRNNKIKIGDIIKVNGVKGKVIAVNLIETKIETNNNEIIFIPNSNITKYEVIKERKNG